MAETILHCEHCDCVLPDSDDNFGDDEITLCHSCYRSHYTRCFNCNRILSVDSAFYLDSNNDDEPLCNTCYEEAQRCEGILSYYFKPVPIFYGEGPRYFGIELEIDRAGEITRNARELLSIANGDQTRIYCKHDGSLDDGFEIVSHPMSLQYHQFHMPWAEIMAKAIQMGYRSHQANTCGIHVHVSRAAFGPDESTQDSVIARILYFFEKHWEELLKFSRRTPRQLERWAARYGYKEHPGEILAYAKKGYGPGRYVCVNLQNTDTIEFRIFRGSLIVNTMMATLQLVDRICDVALALSDEELKGMSWSTFVAGCTQPELVQYLKERRLYVNEPVEAKEEL